MITHHCSTRYLVRWVAVAGFLAAGQAAQASVIVNESINATNQTGWVRAAATFSPGQMIVGISTGPANYNGVATFQLPVLNDNAKITSASLTFVTQNSGAVVGANIDLWSLGYTASPTLTTSQYIASNTDPVSGRFKLVDNFILAGVNVTGTKQTTASQNLAIADYLQDLYETDGFATVSGKYLQVRVNPDAVPSTGSFRFGGANAGAVRPVLAITYVIPAPGAGAAMGLAVVGALMRRRRP